MTVGQDNQLFFDYSNFIFYVNVNIWRLPLTIEKFCYSLQVVKNHRYIVVIGDRIPALPQG